MKKIIYIFTMLFLLVAGNLAEKNISLRADSLPLPPLAEDSMVESSAGIQSTLNWESYYFSFDQNSSLNNRYRYFLSAPSIELPVLGRGWSFNHDGSFRKSRNDRFNRSSYSHEYNWMLERTHQIREPVFNYALIFAHNQASDEARTDDRAYEIAKTRKRVGLNLSVNNSGNMMHGETIETYSAEQDILLNETYLGWHSGMFYVRSDEMNSNTGDEVNNNIDSDGYHISNQFNLYRNLKHTVLSVDAHLEQLSIDYDYLRKYGLIGKVDLISPDVNAVFDFGKQTRKIYLLDDMIDTHVRTNYSADVGYYQILAADMKVSLKNRLGIRDNRLTNVSARNYLEIDNEASLNSSYEVWRLRFFSAGINRQFSRVFKEDIGNRTQEHNELDIGLTYKHNRTDSLRINRKVALTKTDYSVSTSNLNNDRLFEENSLSLHLLFKDRINMINHFSYSRREEIFISSEMSGNNKVIRTYNLLPSIDIRLNETFRVRQDYHLRADYDDYTFKEWEFKPDDRMYRKFSAAYSLLSYFPLDKASQSSIGDYSSSPFIDEQESGLIDDLNIYSSIPKGFALNLRYIYDTNNSGYLKEGDSYEISDKNEYHTFEIETIRSFPRIEFRLKPRFIWSNDRYEFNHFIGVNYFFPGKRGISSLSLNPSGRNVSNIIWRINFSTRLEW